MNCDFANKNSSLLLYDEIRGWKKVILKHHLKKCEKCQTELEILKKSQEIMGSAIRKKKLTLNEKQLWQNINAAICSQNTETVKPKWKSENKFFRKRAFYFSFGAVLILLTFLVGFSQFWQKEQNQTSFETKVEIKHNYPVIESVNKKNVTVMTYLTDDPKITIVWFFED